MTTRFRAARQWCAIAALASAAQIAAASLPPAAPAVPATEDARTTSTARLLAGVPSSHPAHAALAASAAWDAHRAALAPQWERLRRERLGVIEDWRDDVLGRELPKCRTLLYPFSGPDFLNAYLLFPRCETFVFFGLELPGDVPALEAMSAADNAALLKDVRVALGDMLQRNYFITSHMARQVHTPRLKGVTPLVLASMGLLDVRVLAVEPLAFAPVQGVPAKPRRMQGIRFVFTHPAVGRPQTLYYFSLDATDAALRANPDFLPFLAQFKGSYTFLKSASYLLHGNEFAGTRTTLLEVSDLLVQDDTGIPYRYLKERGYEVRLFGRYARPIRDFKYGYQKDLAAAYQTGGGNIAELPFPFGYHWQDGRSGMMVARQTARRL